MQNHRPLKKPPVLSDEEIAKALHNAPMTKLKLESMLTDQDRAAIKDEMKLQLRAIAEVQRDDTWQKAQAYYEPEVDLYRTGCKELIEAGKSLGAELAKCKSQIQQAKAEVAREIIKLAKKEVKFSLRQKMIKFPSLSEQEEVSRDLELRLNLNQSLKDKDRFLKKEEKIK